MLPSADRQKITKSRGSRQLEKGSRLTAPAQWHERIHKVDAAAAITPVGSGSGAALAQSRCSGIQTVR